MAYVANLENMETWERPKQIHEDVVPQIVDTTPQRTPFLYLIGRAGAQQTRFEWLMDYRGKPKVPGTDNVMAIPEGQDATFLAPVATNPEIPTTLRKRLSNLTHIFRMTFDVSGSMRSANTIGVPDEFSYQAQRAAKQIPREIEFALFNSTINEQIAAGNSLASPDADSFVSGARRMAGLAFTDGGWMESPLDNTQLVQAGNPLSADESATVDVLVGTPALTDVIWLDNLQKMYLKGGNPNCTFVRPVQKRIMSTFNESALMTSIPANQRQIQADTRKVIFPVDYFITEFGPMQVFLEEYIPDDRVYNIEVDQCYLTTFRPFEIVPLAKIGDSEKGMVHVELSLRVDAPNCLGAIDDLKTTLP